MQGIGTTLHNASSCAIVEAITKLAQALGKSVIAEGVKTAEQVDLLRHVGCTYAQGYLWGQPMPAAELQVLLLNNIKARTLREQDAEID